MAQPPTHLLVGRTARQAATPLPAAARTAGPAALKAALLAGLAGCMAGACNPSGARTRLQTLTAVCVPDPAPADQRFDVKVTGGCGGGPDAYECQVGVGDGTVSVALYGPGEACAPGSCGCETYEKPCVVPALSARTWAFQFEDNAAFNRSVTAVSGAPDLCGPGGADGGP